MQQQMIRTMIGVAMACAWPLLALAAEPAAQTSRHCAPTASLPTRNYPGAEAIPTINDLPLPAGKAAEAPGQKILITGQVLDAGCVPVSGAVVEMWQNDPYGRWILATPEDLVDARPVFDGAGRTSTDNQGVFHFITLFPAATKEKQKKSAVTERAPNFNIRIEADGVKPFSTVLYFAGDRRNGGDAQFRGLNAAAQQSVSIPVDDRNAELLTGKITLVLPAKLPYRGY